MTDFHTLIVGAGFAGIGTGIQLDKAGIHDYAIVEAAEGAGGTWYWNTYPGIAVDIPSFSYQFSFEQSTDWTRTYAPGHELRAYAEHCVDKYGLRSKIRFNTKVLGATFDDEQNLWRVTLDDGDEVTARFVVNASGVLTVPNLPDIDGVDSFAGLTMHTARWDHGQDLTGKRVAIIGTGASAVQVIPEIAPIVKQLTVFQRTPIWCFPKFDAPLPPAARRAMRIPGGMALQRLISQAYVELTFPLAAQYFTLNPLAKRMDEVGKAYLRKQVDDPVVRDQLTPRYAVGCKRPGFHNEYLATFNRDNVTLETDRIERITKTGIRTESGSLHKTEILVLATGFKVFERGNVPPFEVRGVGEVNLEEWWDERRLQAYEGVSVPGFPNSFLVLGPYGYNGSSYFNLIENQARHIVRVLKRARRELATWVEVRPEANERYFRTMLARRHNQIVWQDSCSVANSYYFDRHGDVPFRPSLTLETMWRSARFDLDDYRFEASAA
ncbi:MAG: NAD(P)/FAD-dependent oxidoreductase [Mycobacterium sp.]|nr:NAD(P)/FAD-dependent oxidoreductase [Mycobacterium sp.]